LKQNQHRHQTEPHSPKQSQETWPKHQTIVAAWNSFFKISVYIKELFSLCLWRCIKVFHLKLVISWSFCSKGQCEISK